MNYKTVGSTASCSFVEKRSEFIGHICHAESSGEAVDFINKIRGEHRKAKHNVYAYVLRHDNISRYSDDGEPQGTAGVPVLDVILKNGLTDVCCVVTRYFGGILLGGGGLVRAYSHSASLAIETADVMDMFSCAALRLTMNYDIYGKVSYVLPEFEVKQTDSSFEDNVSLTLNVKDEMYDPLCKKLTDITNGKIEIEKIGEMFADFSK